MHTNFKTWVAALTISCQRPETAAFLRTLGARSEERFTPHDYDKIHRDEVEAAGER